MKGSSHQIYRHYKNKFYKYFGLVKHSETLEDLVLYKPISDNLENQLWVRPKAMFFEKIQLDGKLVPRFEPFVFKYSVFKELDQITKHSLIVFASSFFPDFNENKLDLRLADKKNILIQLVTDNLNNTFKIIGFKIGYELSNSAFYSWLGAVDLNYRNMGIGVELLKQQHKWCETMGFKFIETKTKNQWKQMLLLNLKQGFEIIGTEFDSKNELKILLRKNLGSVENSPSF